MKRKIWYLLCRNTNNQMFYKYEPHINFGRSNEGMKEGKGEEKRNREREE